MNLRREGRKNEILGSGPCHLRELRNLSFVSIQSASAQRLFTASPHRSRSPASIAMQPTQALWKRSSLRRLALTTKQGPHNYYKGNRTGSMGQHTKYGGYIVDYKKVRTYVCPDLTGFNVSSSLNRYDVTTLMGRPFCS